VLASIPPCDEGMRARDEQRTDARRRGGRRARRLVRTSVKRFRASIRRARSVEAPRPALKPISPLFLDPFVELAGRRVPMLLCYGDEPMRLDFERASEGPLASLLDDESNL